MGKDYYKILGLSKNCTEDEIKKAYKKLAIKYHPGNTKQNIQTVKQTRTIQTEKESHSKENKPALAYS